MTGAAGASPIAGGSAWPSQTTPFIDGAFVAEPGADSLDVLDPGSGTSLARVPETTDPTVDAAVAAARRAFDDGPWRRMPVFERGQVIARIAAAIDAQAESLARLEAVNAGKPIAAVRREIAGAARVFAYYAGAMDKVYGDTIPVSPTMLDFTLREPIGVVGQIVPWNFPLLAAAWKLGPALAAGCSVVLKPAPQTPLTALVLGEICAAAGVPPGVVNVLPGGTGTGQRLLASEAVDAIAFTGSSAVGEAVMRAAAAGTRPVLLELGGKNPFILLADADVEAAAKAAVGAAFGNAGQSCSARSMILVERPALPAFTEAFLAAVRALRPGPVLDEATTLGPLIGSAHREQVRGAIARAADSGDRLLLEGGVPDLPGFYLEPSVLEANDRGSLLLREEIFGPVAAIMPFDRDEEALAIANATRYGLNATVWGRDLDRALRLVRDLRSGLVSVNGQPSASLHSVFAPFGGMKRSGVGRELGLQAFDFYTVTKNVTISLSR